MEEAYLLMCKGKVLHVQPYIVEGDGDQLLVLIIQDDWMLKMCTKLSQNNSWAIGYMF
jgi:hypothetical protein